jgi:hypothetical protein
MTRFLSLAMVFVGLMVVTGTASALVVIEGPPHFWGPPPHFPIAAPEIDPASAFAGLTLLAGGLAVLRGRRSRKSDD